MYLISLLGMSEGMSEVAHYLVKLSPTEFACQICHYKATKRHHVLNHIEAKHVQNSTYNCEYCTYVSQTKNALHAHKSRTHRVLMQDKSLF